MHRIDKPVSTTIELHSRHSNKTAHPSRFNPSRAKPWFIMIQQNEIRRRFVYLNIKCQKQHIAFKVFPFFLAQTLLLKERLFASKSCKAAISDDLPCETWLRVFVVDLFNSNFTMNTARKTIAIKTPTAKSKKRKCHELNDPIFFPNIEIMQKYT